MRISFFSSRPGQWLAVAGASSFVSILMLFMVGRENGIEICPPRLVEREYLCYRAPILGLQLGPTYRTARDNPLSNYLRRQDWFPSGDSRNAAWIPVFASSMRGVRLGDGWVLSILLNLQDRSKRSVLLDWSVRHQDLAEVFWPIVIKAACAERYDLLPRMLRMARSASDPLQLRRDLALCLSEP